MPRHTHVRSLPLLLALLPTLGCGKSSPTIGPEFAAHTAVAAAAPPKTYDVTSDPSGAPIVAELTLAPNVPPRQGHRRPRGARR
jgi:hypothetical protein